MDIACIAGEVQVVKLLLNESRIDINAMDEKGRNGFQWACQRGHFKLIQLFIQEHSHRIKIHAADNDGKNAYDMAIDYGHNEVAGLLSKHFNKS